MQKNHAPLGALHTHTHTIGYNLQLRFEEKFKLGLVCKKINRKEKIKLE